MVSSRSKSDIYPEEIEITYYTTPISKLDNYDTATKEQRIDVLKNARFRKTWYISSGKNVGKATLKAPFPKNPELRLWTGKIPKTELEDLILYRHTSEPTRLSRQRLNRHCKQTCDWPSSHSDS